MYVSCVYSLLEFRFSTITISQLYVLALGDLNLLHRFLTSYLLFYALKLLKLSLHLHLHSYMCVS